MDCYIGTIVDAAKEYVRREGADTVFMDVETGTLERWRPARVFARGDSRLAYGISYNGEILCFVRTMW